MSKPHFNVYGIGQCALDFLGKINDYPPVDAKCEFTDLAVQDGGPVATALVALQRWGYSCAFSGITGDDIYGSQIRESLSSEGVNISGLKLRKNSGSQVAFAMANPKTGERNIFWRRATGTDLLVNEIDADLLKQCSLYHTDGFFAEASTAACKIARNHGILNCVDAGSMRPGMLDLAENCNFFIASEPFAKSFAPDCSPQETCYKLAELGADVVAVTLGDQGYVAVADGELIQGQAYKMDTIDTTGCGDLFHAGFIYGILKKWPVSECLDFGAWAAAMVSRYLGGRKGIPTLAEIEKYRNELKRTS